MEEYERLQSLIAEQARLGLWFQRHLLPPKELEPHLTNLDEEGNQEEL